jgi:hypothetical protein
MISERDIERIAEALSARLSVRPEALWQVEQVAEYLSVKPSWVYEHAETLGVVRLGDGKRKALRFDPQKIDAYVTSCSCRQESEAPKPLGNQGLHRLRRSSRSSVPNPVPKQASKAGGQRG